MIAMDSIRTSIERSKLDPQELNGAIHPYFIELNHAKALEANLKALPYSPVPYEVVDGKFEEKICGILSGRKGDNVFLYIDPYGIKALDSHLFKTIQSFEFRSFEMLINFNSFGFFRDACQVMRVDYTHDAALRDLDDLVEYEPTTVDSDQSSEKLLTDIAGGDYWKDIVKDYQQGTIDGYQAEINCRKR